MKKTHYLFIMLWVGIPIFLQLSVFLLLSLSIHQVGDINLIYLRTSGVGGPIPTSLLSSTPIFLKTIVFWLTIILILNRIWEFIKNKSIKPPTTYNGAAPILAYISFIFFIIAVVLYGISYIGVSTGVLLGMAMLPITFLAPLAFFITEIHSLILRVKK